MKRLIFLILGFSLFLAACSKDDNDDYSNDEEYSRLIVGTWQQKSATDCEKCEQNTYLTFFANDSLFVHSKCEELNCDCQECHTMFGEFEYDEDEHDTWEIVNGYLKVSSNELSDWENSFIDALSEIKILSITDKEMKIEISAWEGLVKEKITYRKIK